MIWQSSIKTMCFVGSPQLHSIEEVNYFGLGLSDFSLHDPCKDTLFTLHFRSSSSPGPSPDPSPSSSLSDSSLNHHGCPMASRTPNSSERVLQQQQLINNNKTQTTENGGLLSTFFNSRLMSSYGARVKNKIQKTRDPHRRSIINNNTSLHLADSEDTFPTYIPSRRRSADHPPSPIPALDSPPSMLGSLGNTRISPHRAQRSLMENCFELVPVSSA